jgi:Leucine Rich repeat
VPMAALTVNSTSSYAASPPQSERARLDDLLTRPKALRHALALALFIVLAPLFAAISIGVGTHLVTAWWFQSLHCRVAWEMDETNWLHGGATSVSYGWRNAWNQVFGDADLKHLRKLFRVVKLDFAECDKITNAGLASLSGLEFLSELNLARLNRYRHARYGFTSAPLTDACLIHLKSLPRLETLSLAGNQVTDRGLSQIARIANLKSLDLEATEISDAGLVPLVRMKNLKAVYLGATRVTKEGIAELQMARPDLTIDLDVEPAVEEGVKLRRGVTQ